MSRFLVNVHVDAHAGERVYARRVELGLSQRDLDDLTGLSYAYISRVENGQRRPSLSALILLAEALRMPPLELATGNRHGHCPYCERGG